MEDNEVKFEYETIELDPHKQISEAPQEEKSNISIGIILAVVVVIALVGAFITYKLIKK